MKSNKVNAYPNIVMMPVSIRAGKDGISIVSFLLPRSYYREPFFMDSLADKLKAQNARIELPQIDDSPVRKYIFDNNDPNVIVTPIEDFIEEHSLSPSDNKLGFIFHMSRCGSTLFTQMLSTSKRFFVMSEPNIIDAVLDPTLVITRENRKKLLTACVNALKSCSPVLSEYLFIKFRSWNTLYLDLILEGFPNTNWLFIHRNGLEVMSSVFKQPSGWVNGRKVYEEYFCDFLGVSKSDMKLMSNDEYVSRMLGAFCHAVNHSTPHNNYIIDYVDLKSSYFMLIKKLWGIDLSKNECKEMKSASQIYSKDLSRKIEFKADSEEKRSSSTVEQVELSTKFIETERTRFNLLRHIAKIKTDSAGAGGFM